MHRPECFGFISDVSEAKGNSNAINAVVVEWEELRIGLNHINVTQRTLVDKAIAADGQHGGVNICQDNFAISTHQF